MSKLHVSAYEVLEERTLKDIESQGYILKHKKSGARVCVISNSDDNKVFSIGFRTPPEDETGVPHIIEHDALWFFEVSGQGSVYRTGEGIAQHIFECHDISGEDVVSSCQLQ